MKTKHTKGEKMKEYVKIKRREFPPASLLKFGKEIIKSVLVFLIGLPNTFCVFYPSFREVYFVPHFLKVWLRKLFLRDIFSVVPAFNGFLANKARLAIFRDGSKVPSHTNHLLSVKVRGIFPLLILYHRTNTIGQCAYFVESLLRSVKNFWGLFKNEAKMALFNGLRLNILLLDKEGIKSNFVVL